MSIVSVVCCFGLMHCVLVAAILNIFCYFTMQVQYVLWKFCPSVTPVDSTEMATCIIKVFSPHVSHIILVTQAKI